MLVHSSNPGGLTVLPVTCYTDPIYSFILRTNAMNTPTWDEFAELALNRIAKSGAEYGDIRIQDSSTEQIEGEDRRIASIRDINDIGFGVRVLYHGAWGFAASSILSLEEVPRVADLAVEIAKGSASVALEKVRLAPEP